MMIIHDNIELFVRLLTRTYLEKIVNKEKAVASLLKSSLIKEVEVLKNWLQEEGLLKDVKTTGVILNSNYTLNFNTCESINCQIYLKSEIKLGKIIFSVFFSRKINEKPGGFSFNEVVSTADFELLRTGLKRSKLSKNKIVFFVDKKFSF